MESLRLLDDNVFTGIKNRILQGLARMAPSATTPRVWPSRPWRQDRQEDVHRNRYDYRNLESAPR